MPRLYADARRAARARLRHRRRGVPPFLRIGLVDRRRPRRQSVRRRRHARVRDPRAGGASRSSTTSTKCIGSAPSCRCRRASSRRRRSCCALAAAAHDANPHRQDEPYRQALIGIYARLAATRRRAVRLRAAARAARRRCRRTRTPARVPRGPRHDRARRSRRTARRRSPRGRLEPLRARGRRVRLSSRGARPAPEQRRARGGRRASCCARAGVAADYAQLDEAARVDAARARARQPAPARIAASRLFASARVSELAILRAAADIHRALRRGGAAELRDLQVPVGVRPAGGGGAAEGSRTAARRRARRQHRPAVRDDRRPRALRRRSCARRSRCRSIARWSPAAATGRK